VVIEVIEVIEDIASRLFWFTSTHGMFNPVLKQLCGQGLKEHRAEQDV
jgi:hypothetical protein